MSEKGHVSSLIDPTLPVCVAPSEEDGQVTEPAAIPLSLRAFNRINLVRFLSINSQDVDTSLKVDER